jgi:hypothetical protein
LSPNSPMSPKLSYPPCSSTCTNYFTASCVFFLPPCCFLKYSFICGRINPDTSESSIFMLSKVMMWFLCFYLITLISESVLYSIYLQNILLLLGYNTICIHFRRIREYSGIQRCPRRPVVEPMNVIYITILVSK